MGKFTAPDRISPFYNFNRIPRKKKKKHKILLNKYSFLTLNEKLWLILRTENKEYSDFIINEICRKNEK